MTISIIIPTCASGKYLWECLDSLEKQSLDKGEYEVIVVLNGEKPHRRDELETKSKRQFQMNIRWFYSERKGVSYARNLGLDEAKGAYITFIDDDDLVSANYLESLLDNRCEDGITVANPIAFRGIVKNRADHYLTDAFQKYDARKKTSLFRNRSLLSSACCKLIPRQLIGGIRFRTDLTHGEDSFFMFMVSPGIKQVLITPPAAIYYIRKRDNSASRSRQNKRKKQEMELKLFYLYAKEYFRHPRKYNLLFFISRIVATAYKLLLEDYVRPL